MISLYFLMKSKMTIMIMNKDKEDDDEAKWNGGNYDDSKKLK